MVLTKLGVHKVRVGHVAQVRRHLFTDQGLLVNEGAVGDWRGLEFALDGLNNFIVRV